MSDDLERQLTNVLGERAGAVPLTRTTGAAVAARATVVRRARRRRAVGGAVGGVLAVVAVAVLTQQPDSRSTGEPAPATAPSASLSSGPVRDATDEASQRAAALADLGAKASSAAARSSQLRFLPTGRGPGTGVVVGSTYSEFTMTDPDRVIPLPALPDGTHVAHVSAYVGGVLVGDDRYFEGSAGLHLVTDDGRSRELGPCTSGLGAASPDGSRVAWVTFACPESGVAAPTVLHVLDADGAERTRELEVSDTSPGTYAVHGWVGDRVVVAGSDDTLVLGLTGPPTSFDSGDGVLSVGAATGAVAMCLDGQRACAVLDAATGEVRFTSPAAWPLGEFSPDGSQVLAYQAHEDGRLAIRVLDARTGEVRHELSLPAGLRADGHDTPVWADDTHLLLLAADDTGHAVVRADLDGKLERATEVYPSTTPLLIAR